MASSTPTSTVNLGLFFRFLTRGEPRQRSTKRSGLNIRALSLRLTAVVALIGKFTNEELFIKAYFPWTGTTSLGSYFVSATSSHYEWAIKKLRAFTRKPPE